MPHLKHGFLLDNRRVVGLYHNKTVGGFTTKGRFAFNAMLGFMGRFKKTGGVLISAGFSTISFRNNFTTTPTNTYNGAKISAGFIF